MKVKIKRIDKSLELPTYKTHESAGFDFFCRESITIAPRETKIIRANNIIEAPHGYFLAVLARSSLFFKKGLMLANSMGVVDRDFSGPDDEIGLIMWNPGDKAVTVDKGERIAQGLFIPVVQAEWDEVDEVRKDSRGGFGSTG
ncbi:MAG: dUTPase [Candidatus Doudnabacteria bacterium RIFCSPHIGHO2_01_FULL_49_9]|uniref:dUTP diphosphatase n=1 Tax=Candidatus Doudnabacteria bacterium RIFCSPHIGHO2_01_FULL_49_9 TaxID=1817827 RepID=A0A1F5P2G0_9BACT|nr:MAG: dUTPase [Candidatus Doudnabacteria bacterium RIFCSPHIGHO2_01_FULL_49_9]